MNITQTKSLGNGIIGLIALLFVVSPVFASGETTYGQSVYGGGVVEPREGNFLIDKSVKNPASDAFVDHLGADDPRYQPGQIITFRIKINNPGDETLEKLTVTDTFPVLDGQRVIDYMSGPGEYNEKTNSSSFEVSGLGAGQSKEFEIKGKIVHASVLPGDQTILCPEPGNMATAKTADREDNDESRFCIERESKVTVVPEAGPAQWMLMFSGLGSALASGIYLRRRK